MVWNVRTRDVLPKRFGTVDACHAIVAIAVVVDIGIAIGIVDVDFVVVVFVGSSRGIRRSIGTIHQRMIGPIRVFRGPNRSHHESRTVSLPFLLTIVVAIVLTRSYQPPCEGHPAVAVVVSVSGRCCWRSWDRC